MSNDPIKQTALELINRSGQTLLASNSPDGFPLIKAMLKMENEGLHTVWLCAHLSARRTGHLQQDNRCSLYFVDQSKIEGLLLVGHIEILRDAELRKRFWRDLFFKFYPAGVDDPDYCIYKFTALRGNYYHAQQNTDFAI